MDTLAEHPEMALSDLRVEAEKLIAALGRPVRSVSLRAGANVVEVDWADQPATAPVDQPAPAPVAAPTAPSGHRIVAPLVGTFYAAPGPGEPPFVRVGDLVRAGDQVAIVEAMKLLNPITADRAGRVTAIHVADGDMVEFEQVLVELEPAD